MKTNPKEKCCKECRRRNSATEMMRGGEAFVCVAEDCPTCHQSPQQEVEEGLIITKVGDEPAKIGRLHYPPQQEKPQPEKLDITLSEESAKKLGKILKPPKVEKKRIDGVRCLPQCNLPDKHFSLCEDPPRHPQPKEPQQESWIEVFREGKWKNDPEEVEAFIKNLLTQEKEKSYEEGANSGVEIKDSYVKYGVQQERERLKKIIEGIACDSFDQDCELCRISSQLLREIEK